MAYTGNLPSVTQFPYQYLTGDGINQNFTLNYPVANSSSILVSINGLHVALSDYTAGGYTIRFNTAPVAGVQIEVVWLGVPTVTQGSGFYSNIILTTTLAGVTITSSTVPPTASFQIGGVLGVASGGTGITTAGQNLLLTTQQGGSGFGTLPYGSSGQVLTSGGTNNLPTWANAVNSFAISPIIGLTVFPPSGTGNVTISGGILAVGFGGTGTAGLSNAGVVLGGGSGALRVVAGSGLAGQILSSNGANNDPTWQYPVIETLLDPTAIPVGCLVLAQLFTNSAAVTTLPTLGGTQVMSAAPTGTYLETGSPAVTIGYGTWRFLGSALAAPLTSLWVRIA